MIRKSLFWGLTLILVGVLAYLIIRGRQHEKMQASQTVEEIRESKPTPTRVFAPGDLEIIKATAILDRQPDSEQPAQTAVHEVEIRNSGKIPYGAIRLAFDYFDRKGVSVGTRSYTLEKTIMPGAAQTFSEVRIEGLPMSAARSKAVLVHADLVESP